MPEGGAPRNGTLLEGEVAAATRRGRRREGRRQGGSAAARGGERQRSRSCPVSDLTAQRKGAAVGGPARANRLFQEGGRRHQVWGAPRGGAPPGDGGCGQRAAAVEEQAPPRGGASQGGCTARRGRSQGGVAEGGVDRDHGCRRGGRCEGAVGCKDGGAWLRVQGRLEGSSNPAQSVSPSVQP